MKNNVTCLLVNITSPSCWSPNLEGLKTTGTSNKKSGFIVSYTNILNLFHGLLWNVYLYSILCQIKVTWVDSVDINGDRIGVGINQSDRAGYRTV